jgi:hypothetical protein
LEKSEKLVHRCLTGFSGILAGVEKRYERRADKAKFGEKAQFMSDK